MDITPYISPIVTAIIAIVGAYGVTKSGNDAKFTELSVQIAELSATLGALKAEVEKHNGVIERTFRLEGDVSTAFKRIDELKQADLRLEERIGR